MPSGYVARKINSDSSSRSARNFLASIAREKLSTLRASRPPTERPRLIDFIHEIAPYFDRFEYFAPYLNELERAIGGNLRIAFAAPPQHGKPLAVGTMVTMSDGTRRPIESLKLGDAVVSGRGRVAHVTGFFPQGELPVQRIRTIQGREILAEASHRFLTQDGWKRVDQLRPYAKANWQRPRGDALQVAQRYELHTASVGRDQARLAGYLIGDGCTSQPGVRFTSADDAVTADFVAIVRSMGCDVAKDGQYDYRVRSRANGNRWSGNHAVLNWARAMGLAGKLAAQKSVPATIMAAPLDEVAHFLAGYFACDGFRGRAGARGVNSEFYSTSRQLLRETQHLLARLGVRAKLKVKNGRYKDAPHRSWRLTILDQVRFFDVVPVVGAKAGPMVGSRRRQRDGLLDDTIVSVTPAGVAECFCITVSRDESFLAEDVVTHNTEATLRAFLYWARYFPGKRHAYVTYNQTRSQEVAKFFQRIAAEAGFTVGGTLSIVELGNGTTIKFTSIEGGLTGYTVDGVCLIDDPIKGPGEARSPTTRRDCQEFWTAVGRARRHEGTSFVIMATRWHVDDLTGYLVNRADWRYINLKAIAEAKGENDIDADGRVISDPLKRKSGESLWRRKPPEFFREERADRYWWSAMYQGEPVPIGGNVFGADPPYYRELPKDGYRGVFGLDLAYTAKTHADWSICAEIWSAPHPDPKIGTAFYVVNVQRKQVAAPDFALVLRTMQSTRPWRMIWYAAGTEKGSADFLKKQGLPIVVKPPKGDKFVRAQPVAAAWNAGKVFLPDPFEFDVPWLQAFRDCVQNFTGVGDAQDDDVDALAAGFDELSRPAPDLSVGGARSDRR